jgi:hypothetical protein
MTDTFKSIEQGLKEAIANGATTHHVVIDLVQATEYIKELEDKLAVAGEALNRLLHPPYSDLHIEVATKEEWATRAMNAEAKLLGKKHCICEEK